MLIPLTLPPATDVRVDQPALPADAAQDRQPGEIQADAQVDGRGVAGAPLPLKVAVDRHAAERALDGDPAAARVDDQVAGDAEVAQVAADEDLAACAELTEPLTRERAILVAADREESVLADRQVAGDRDGLPASRGRP